MQEYAIRLTKGQDIYNEIKQFCNKNNICAAVVASAVGCVSVAKIRDAGGVNIHEISQPLEIVGVMGTVSKNRVHLHASFAKEDLSVIGGHMVEGCIVNTTCELVIISFDKFTFSKIYDESTGYNELLIEEKV